MKYIHTAAIIFLCTIFFYGCKKNKETIDWTPALKSTVWAGLFKYSNGDITQLQPCSLVLNSDGSFNWYEVINPQKGNWKTDGDQLTLTYATGTIFTAGISSANLSSFKSEVNLSFQIADLSKSAMVTEEGLKGTKGERWMGSYSGGPDMSINFDLGKKMLFRKIGEVAAVATYSIEGAGARFSRSGTGGTIVSYCVVKDSSTLNGCDLVVNAGRLYLWNAKMQ